MMSAYRKAYSCHSMLIKLMEDWKEAAVDNNYHIGTVLMDLSRNFDELPHNLLSAKLKAYGMNHSSIKLLERYLSDRRQRVQMGNIHNSWEKNLKRSPSGIYHGSRSV